jgi:helix-turn-helix, Psq domain
MSVQTQEARIILAIEAIQMNQKLTPSAAAKIYNVPRSTLRDRIKGRTPLHERRPPAQKLTDLEEIVLLRYILDLDERGFAPRLASVEDMANYLLNTRGGKRVGKL